MSGHEVPAWAWLLGALVFVAVGASLVFTASLAVLGWGVLGVGFGLGFLGVRAGNRALRETGPPAHQVSAQPVSTVPLAKDKPVDDYGNIAAVRASMQKPKRTCRECGSPVLEAATECPTCASTLA